MIKTGDTFYVENFDMNSLEVGDIFRLKDLYNVKVIEKNNGIIGKYAGDDLISDSLKIQWTTDNYVNLKVYVPHILFKGDKFNNDSLEIVNGFAEEATSKIKTGEIVQFERFGFVRIENIDKKIIGFFTHK